MARLNPPVYKEIIDRYKPEDIAIVQEFVRMDNEDRKDDAQRYMTWFALAGMILYPVLVVICDAYGLDKASDLVSGMSDMYFVSVSAIVMAFFGANAWTKIGQHKKSTPDTHE